MPFLANDITIYDDNILDVLDTISNRRKIPHDIAQRAKIILLANKGYANSQIGKEVGLSRTWLICIEDMIFEKSSQI